MRGVKVCSADRCDLIKSGFIGSPSFDRASCASRLPSLVALPCTRSGMPCPVVTLHPQQAVCGPTVYASVPCQTCQTALIGRQHCMRFLQVVQEVLLWSRQPMEVRRLCARKEDIFRELRGSCAPALPPGTSQLLHILAQNDVRILPSRPSEQTWP